MQHMRSQNRYTGGKVPYGFQLVNGDLVPYKTKQKVLQLVRKYRDKGVSLRKIADTLGRQDIKSRAGKPFHHQAVARLAA